MPIVRLSRDKRGLDTVYLIDTPSDGRRTGRTRVVYFWTAPPGLRVGREAFDAARCRAIEDANPDVAFDWPELMRSLDMARLQVPVPGADVRREGWRSGKSARARQRPSDADADADADGVADSGTTEEAARPSPDAVTLASPTAAGEPSSEEPAATAQRPRRRRRRPRRPGAEGSSSSGADL